jgi:hypothetical protein
METGTQGFQIATGQREGFDPTRIYGQAAAGMVPTRETVLGAGARRAGERMGDSVATMAAQAAHSPVLGGSFGGLPPVGEPNMSVADYVREFKNFFKEAPGPHLGVKRGESIGLTSPEDIEQFRQPSGVIRASVIHGDAVGVHPYIAQDGRMRIGLHGGLRFGLSGNRTGHTSWSSAGEGADTAIDNSVRATGGLGIQVAAKPDTMLSSHGPLAVGAEIDAARVAGVAPSDRDVLNAVNVALAKVGAKTLEALPPPDDTGIALLGAFDGFSGDVFTARKNFSKYLLSTRRSKALGIPSKKEVLDRMVDPLFVGSNAGDVLGFLYQAPGQSIQPGPLGRTEHPIYSLWNQGMTFGAAGYPSRRISLIEAARKDFDDWFGPQQEAYERFSKLTKAQQAAVIRGAAGLTPSKAKEYWNVLGMRQKQPTSHNYMRSLQTSKRPVVLDEDVLRRLFEDTHRAYRTGSSTNDGTATRIPTNSGGD